MTQDSNYLQIQSKTQSDIRAIHFMHAMLRYNQDDHNKFSRNFTKNAKYTKNQT